jgi:putative transposase
MARLPRYFVKGVTLHIILRGNNRDPVFGNDDDYQFFRECLLDAAKRHGLAIHAYVLIEFWDRPRISANRPFIRGLSRMALT